MAPCDLAVVRPSVRPAGDGEDVLAEAGAGGEGQGVRGGGHTEQEQEEEEERRRAGGGHFGGSKEEIANTTFKKYFKSIGWKMFNCQFCRNQKVIFRHSDFN